MVQQVKDLELSLQWLGFDTWPRNLHVMQAQPDDDDDDKYYILCCLFCY